MRTLIGFLLAACTLLAQPAYDLVLKGGHVIDPKNNISEIMDVAIAGGKIARVVENIPASEAKAIATVAGLYVTPVLIDIHVHVYTGTGTRALTGDSSVQPDAFSFRSGVTTMIDAGTSGWRNFPYFREHIIDRAKTRVLALLNIVGAGMGPGAGENNPETWTGCGGQDGQGERGRYRWIQERALQWSRLVLSRQCCESRKADWPPCDDKLRRGTSTAPATRATVTSCSTAK